MNNLVMVINLGYHSKSAPAASLLVHGRIFNTQCRSSAQCTLRHVTVYLPPLTSPTGHEALVGFARKQLHSMKKQIMLAWPTYFPLPFPVCVISSDGMSS